MRKNKKIDEAELFDQLLRDIEVLYTLKREMEYGDICRDSGHALGLCPECESDWQKAMKRIAHYEAQKELEI